MVNQVAAVEPVMVDIPNTKIKMYRRPELHPLVPQLVPWYIFREDLVATVNYAIAANENCMLVGDTGFGKSSLIEQLAAITWTPCYRLNMHGETDVTNLVGGKTITEKDGKRQIEFEWGVLPKAMVEGWWLVLDELDSALQPVLFCLQQVLEDNGKLVLGDGKGTLVRKHPNFRLFATANTLGIAGHHKFMHSGTTRINEATLDRFGVMIHVTRMDPADEMKAIHGAVPNLEVVFVEGAVRIANEMRDALEKEEMSSPFSLRRCIQWAKAMCVWHPMEAAEFTVLNKLNAEDAETTRQIIQRYFG